MPQLNLQSCTLANSASGVATATNPAIGAVSGQVVFLCGLYISGTGATGASTVNATTSGLVSNLTIPIVIPASPGGTVPGLPIVITFNPPLASFSGSAVQLSVPSFGAGSTGQSASLWGFASQS